MGGLTEMQIAKFLDKIAFQRIPVQVSATMYQYASIYTQERDPRVRRALIASAARLIELYGLERYAQM